MRGFFFGVGMVGMVGEVGELGERAFMEQRGDFLERNRDL